MTHHKVHFPKDLDGWKVEFKRAWDIIMLKKPAMTAVAADERALGPAIIFVVLAAFLAAMGGYIFPTKFVGVVYRSNFEWILAQTLVVSIMTILAAVIISLIAEHAFKGKAKISEYFKVFGFAYLIGAIAIIPALSIIGAVWSLVLTFFTLRTVHKIGAGEAVATIVIAIVAIMVLAMFLMPLLGLAGILHGIY